MSPDDATVSLVGSTRVNRRIVTLVLAAIVVAGAVAVIVPQHAVSLARVAATTVAVLTGSIVVRAVAPVVAREPEPTELDRRVSPAVKPLDPHGLRDARRDLDRPTSPGMLPTAVRNRLAAAGVHDVPSAATGTDLRRDPAAVAALVNRHLDSSAGARRGTRHGHH